MFRLLAGEGNASGGWRWSSWGSACWCWRSLTPCGCSTGRWRRADNQFASTTGLILRSAA